MDLHYKLEFFSDWHCGSGLAAGADVDALVVKDDAGLPFVPGKTVKGLLREAMEELISLKGSGMESLFTETFGYFDKDLKEGVKGCAFFSNAELPAPERKAIIAGKLQPFMFRQIASTAIDADGVALDHSLRRMEVTVPCTLEGVIIGLPDNKEFLKEMEDALLYVKRMGQNRNRGLGRCSFSLKSDGK